MSDDEKPVGMIVFGRGVSHPEHTYRYPPRSHEAVVRPHRCGKSLWLAQELQRFMHLNPQQRILLCTRDGVAGEIVGVNLPPPLSEPDER